MLLTEKYAIILKQIEKGVYITYMDLYELPNKKL
jgi:hypothetical protein